MNPTRHCRVLVNAFRRFLLFAALFVLSACAGGSSGTGGRTYDGTVTSSSTGRTLSGVTVMIAGTGEAAVTDAEGRYSIESTSEESTVTFEFNGPSIQASYTLSDISPAAEVVNADFEISEETEEVVLTHVDVREHNEHDEEQNVQEQEHQSEQQNEEQVQEQQQEEQQQQQEEQQQEQQQQEEQQQNQTETHQEDRVQEQTQQGEVNAVHNQSEEESHTAQH